MSVRMGPLSSSSMQKVALNGKSLSFMPDKNNAYATHPFKSGDSYFVWVHNINAKEGMINVMFNEKKTVE